MGYMEDRAPFIQVSGTLETPESLVTTPRRFDFVHKRSNVSQPVVAGPHWIHRVPAGLESDDVRGRKIC